ncbi:MAG: prepilin-type N-terminal cleavage/methylation domain-containing protein [Thomasclavelia sp.]|uniref:prepilin-type N-terminal cleavage/methylation domain-containing protein n=1 Tax=Thomasclavelia sp. TaxID=3025757 RepID=UPI0039A17BAC
MSKKIKFYHKNKGFTLVELIVVLVILAILAALLIPALTSYIDKANESKVEGQLRILSNAAQSAYNETYATYPEIKGESQVVYNKVSSNSTQPWDVLFTKKVKSYIGTDLDINNIISMGYFNGNLKIFYKYGDSKYLYSKEKDGTVTIEKY